jgi:hypothetical protein
MENFVRGVWAFWKETWRLDKRLFFAEAIGTFLGMGAATMMGFQSPSPNLLWVFSMYLVSAILLVYSSYKRHSSWMVVLMAFYSITTTIGLLKL